MEDVKVQKILIGAFVTKEFAKEMDLYRITHNFANRGDFLRYALKKQMNNGVSQ